MRWRRTRDLTPDVDALAEASGGRVGMAGVLDGLDQRLRRTWAPGLAVRRAWAWAAADRRDHGWWPQGISTSPISEAVLVTSWYATDGGSRLSLVDLERRRYRHVSLVRATADGGHTPLAIHAGGIAWHGTWLQVAATYGGFWTCHVDDVIRDGPDYLMPVRFSYAPIDGEDRLRCSFLGVDISTRPSTLVIGEYGHARQPHRLARITLDEKSGLPADDEGVICASVADHGVVRAQGVAVVGPRLYVTSSHGPRKPGSVWSGAEGLLRRHRWATPIGPEDLAYSPASDTLWTVTEHPRRRWIVAMRRSRFDT